MLAKGGNATMHQGARGNVPDEGDKIAGDKKSYAVSFILQDNDATLTDVQIEKIMEKLAKNYSEKLGAVIRS